MIGQPPRRHGGRGHAQQSGQRGRDIALQPAFGQQAKHDEYAEQGLDERIGEGQGRDALAGDPSGPRDPSERGVSDRAIVADPSDVQQASIGLKADLPQGGEVRQPFADPEVAGIIDGGLGPQRAPLLVVRLDARAFVVDVQRRRDPLGDDPGPRPPGRAGAHTPVEDQLDLIRSPEVEVLANDLLEKRPARRGTVQHLREAELGLPDRQPITIAGAAIPRGKRVGQTRQPLAPQGLDLRPRQAIAQRLQLRGRGAGEDAVVQGLIGNPPPGAQAERPASSPPAPACCSAAAS